MIALKTNREVFGGIEPFELTASYIEIDSRSPLNVYDDHIHNECEIYVNMSGDVSFVVENSVYPVMPGGIIITRPLEYHHCIYHTNRLHKHFWILFSASGNERLLDVFYDREPGKCNLLMLPADRIEELFSLCRRLTDGCRDEAERFYLFFRLMALLRGANAVNAPEDSGGSAVIKAINCINQNLSRELTVTGIARECNVSVNTLERCFLRELNCSPSAYIRKKRLAHAAKLLSEGRSVTEAAESSGFADCSNFISHFRKAYQITPLQYKNRIRDRDPRPPAARGEDK